MAGPWKFHIYLKPKACPWKRQASETTAQIVPKDRLPWDAAVKFAAILIQSASVVLKTTAIFLFLFSIRVFTMWRLSPFLVLIGQSSAGILFFTPICSFVTGFFSAHARDTNKRNRQTNLILWKDDLIYQVLGINL